MYNYTPPPYGVPRELELTPHSLTPTLSGVWWACTLQCAARHHDRWPTQSSKELMSTLTRRHPHWPASKSTPSCSWHLQCTGSDQHDILPPRLDGSTAGAIDIQHLASQRRCTGGGEGRRRGRLEKALSAVFVSRSAHHGN